MAAFATIALADYGIICHISNDISMESGAKYIPMDESSCEKIWNRIGTETFVSVECNNGGSNADNTDLVQPSLVHPWSTVYGLFAQRLSGIVYLPLIAS